jgi:phosphatidylglycerol:prolipoprotein diacylglycerol transferase
VRFGNLMNSEECGRPTGVPWAFVFVQLDDIPRHPVVLYESICYFIIQIVMLGIFNKYLESKPGLYVATFLVLVFSVRFVLEFMKVPDGGLHFGLISTSQALTLPFIFTGVVLWYFVANDKLHYKNIPVKAHGKI